MVLLKATDSIISALEAVPTTHREELELPATLELHGPITHEQLIRLSKHLKQNTQYNSLYNNSDPKNPTLLSFLLRGTKVYVPPPPKKPEPVRLMDFPPCKSILQKTLKVAMLIDTLPEPRIPRLES